MTTTAPKRVNVSTLTELVETNDTMDFNDWKLNFSYKGKSGEPIVNVMVTGNKPIKNGDNYMPTANFIYNKNGNNVNISFNNTDFDVDLATAIKTEVDKIITP